MPNNASTTREKIVNFSRRFNRSTSSDEGYFGANDDEPAAVDRNSGLSSHSGFRDSGIASPVSSSQHTSSSSGASSSLSAYQLRPPSEQRTFSQLLSTKKDFYLPDLPWLCGTWHVTHSTLPMWHGKRNVRITYTRLPGNRLDDLVTFQNMQSNDIQSVRGVDHPRKDGSYVWRGKGLLNLASSKWEVLGWGGGGATVKSATAALDGHADTIGAADPANTVVMGAAPSDNTEQWVVTYFARTLFTPAGIDIYSRSQAGLSPRTLATLKAALARVDGSRPAPKGGGKQSEFSRLVDQIFEVGKDEARRDLVGASIQ